MEFKGTKENWKIDNNIIFADDYFQTHIAVLPATFSEEVTLANGLLMTKAPEMLKMLTEISKTAEKIWEIEQDNPFFDEIDFAELDDLIKSATELK
nr:hypothetical protein [uncultured Chryseobacterium sp.]